MADDGLLGRIGSGLGTGLGTALTPLAMLMAARGGRDPMAILRAGQEDELARQLQQQQLANQKLATLGTQAGLFEDPTTRAFMGLNPAAAQQAGVPIETAPAGIASPEALSAVGIGPGMMGTPSGNIGLLPPQPQSTAELARQGKVADTAWQTFVNNLASGAMGGGAGGATGAAPGPAGSITPPGTAPATGGPPMVGPYVFTGFTGNQPTFALPKTETFEAGTVVEPGGKGVTGGQQLRSGNVAAVKPSRVGAMNKQRVSLINSAQDVFKTIYEHPITDAKTGATFLPEDILPSRHAAVGLSGVLAEAAPGVASLRTRTMTAGYGSDAENEALQRLKSGEGTVVTFVKAMGDAANAAVPEQLRAQAAFLPNTSDTRESAKLKRELTPKVLAAVEKRLADMQDRGEFEGLDEKAAGELTWGVFTQAAEQMRAQVAAAGGGEGPGAPTGGTNPLAPGGASVPPPAANSPDALEAARKKVYGVGYGEPSFKRRALGGPINRGQIGLVGEQGPELVAGPSTVYPMQLAQAAPAPPVQMRPRGVAPGMGGGTPVPVDPNVPKPPRMIGGTLGAATAKPTPQPAGGIGVGVGLSDADIARQKANAGGVQIIQGPDGGFHVVTKPTTTTTVP